jgi:hypothetical protein
VDTRSKLGLYTRSGLLKVGKGGNLPTLEAPKSGE